MATGILPVFIGRATRAVEFADKSDKEYVAALKLGVVTSTQDTTGEVVERHSVNITRAKMEEMLTAFRGEITQIPPMYSAVKIGGKKLYELARKGETVERAARPVTIHALGLLEVPPLGWPVEEDTYWLRIKCSKGTYIRTLCHDIGQELGCGGAMAALRRTEACGFTAEDAVSLEQVMEIVEQGKGETLLRPVDTMFTHLPALTVLGKNESKVRNGQGFPLPTAAEGDYRVYNGEGDFLMVGRVAEGRLTTVKNFFEV